MRRRVCRPDVLRGGAPRAILSSMANLITTLRARGVEKAFPLLQLDFFELIERLLTRGNARAYSHHEWVVRNVHPLGCIVNAVPRREMLEELLWEEWFRKDGKTRHHILSLKRPSRFDEVYVAPEHDDIHPEGTFGRTWYVVDDPDMTPMLLRGRGRTVRGNR